MGAPRGDTSFADELRHSSIAVLACLMRSGRRFELQNRDAREASFVAELLPRGAALPGTRQPGCGPPTAVGPLLGSGGGGCAAIGDVQFAAAVHALALEPAG